MTFLIVTHVLHTESGEKYFAYAPYVREINLWLIYPDKVVIVAPLDRAEAPGAIDLEYDHPDIEFIPIPEFDIQGTKSILRTVFLLPVLISRINRGMKRADHIHLRCPGNVGLLGCIVQIFFPGKKKTAKYAGNWHWNSQQPWSYRLQHRILRNIFLTRNMTALVYGDWPDMTKNIRPFFTASYSEKDKQAVYKRPLSEVINLAFVGTLTKNKSPLTCLEVLRALTDKGINATLTYCGEGSELIRIGQKIQDYQLKDKVILLGNVNAEKVKEVLREAHFLLFISRSEGWPKAVSEAMWWGCLPVTTPVSCVPWMLDNGSRGELVNGEVTEITSLIEGYISDQKSFNIKSENAMDWSREYTLERFESEIKQLF
ncbi:MAG TPA: glycosyl transferase [Bacteroidales bacterium]|nr:glycosyl transferase [Bacteroidales bacterium]